MTTRRWGWTTGGLYISCVEYRDFSFVGNTVLAINKAPMLTGAANPQTYWWNDALKIKSDAGPALELSPALEEGVQDAAFISATDAGYGTNSNDLSVCALTNQSNIATVAPTMSCVHHDLSISYIDPISAHQPGGGTINVGYGTKQVYYKAGRLFLAWTVSNLILWAEVRPVLDFQAPRQMYRVDEIQAAGAANLDLGLGASDDVYTPSIIGTDEDDIVLVYNASGSSRYPSIYYSGRKAADEVRFMGYPDHGAAVVAGTHSTTALWGKYSACAISLNSVTRGGVWCVGEYAGLVADPGWNTRLINLRAE